MYPEPMKKIFLEAVNSKLTKMERKRSISPGKNIIKKNIDSVTTKIN